MAGVVLLQGAQFDSIRIVIRHGGRFEQEIGSAFSQISIFPEAAPVYYRTEGIRRILIPDSPLSTFYSVVGQRVLVIALLDLRMDPNRIREGTLESFAG